VDPQEPNALTEHSSRALHNARLRTKLFLLAFVIAASSLNLLGWRHATIVLWRSASKPLPVLLPVVRFGWPIAAIVLISYIIQPGSARPLITRQSLLRRSSGHPALIRIAIGMVAVTLSVIAIVVLPEVIVAYDTTGVTLRGVDRVNAINDVRQTLAQIVGGCIVVAGALATWKQLQLNRDVQVTDRYAKAIEQLGNEAAHVRLGAIYALDRIARDSSQDRDRIRQVLAAYVRGLSSQTQTEDMSNRNMQAPFTSSRCWADVDAAMSVLGEQKSENDARPLNLVGANLRGANLRFLHLEFADLTKADLGEADLRDAFLIGARLERVMLQSANLSRANLSDAVLKDSNLEGVTACEGVLTGADLTRADLVHADLSDARLDRATLVEASLTHARLSGADLRAADMRGGGRGTHLTYADLRGADLTDANLAGTHMNGSALQGAKMRGAHLAGVVLEAANADTSTEWPDGWSPDRVAKAGVRVRYHGHEPNGTDAKKPREGKKVRK
jgi:uncharacterized protein YjbI with pentapeptide repeats